jgi:ABC-type multidrug transport system fused ATPase/permease subunit
MRTIETTARPPANGAHPLAYWLKVFAPEYRVQMGSLIALSLLSALATFVNLRLLSFLPEVMGRDAVPTTPDCSFGWIGKAAALFAGCGTGLSVLLVVALGISLLSKGIFDYWSFGSGARLDQQAAHDIEREVLRNLLQQDDDFYVRRSPSEVINRLGGDLQRVGGRRRTFAQIVANSASILAIAIVLIHQSIVAAAIGLVISIIGVLASQMSVSRMQSVEDEARVSDDRVKAAFEDSLQGVPEIQVQNLYPRVIREFEALQRFRDGLSLQYADVNRRSIFHQQTTFAFGLVGVLLVVLALVQTGSGAGPGSPDRLIDARLLVVLTIALPQLYFNFSELARMLLQFQIAGVSAQRLSQYQSFSHLAGTATEMAERSDRASHSPSRGETPGAIVLRNIRYQFHPDGVIRGGADGISCEIPARGLTGIIGPAGSGKTTLVRLILGRQRPVSGEISYGGIENPFEGEGDTSRFAYLPQRPILFDATLRDNLFFAKSAPAEESLAPYAETLTPLGAMELIRQKGLDGYPARVPRAQQDIDIARARRELYDTITAELGITLRPLGAGNSSPRQFVIENQLNCAVDHNSFPVHLLTREAEAILRRLVRESSAVGLLRLARSLIRQTAPLLEQSSSPEAYNGIASVMIDPAVWQLRSMALQFADLAPETSDGGVKSSALLIAIALSARIEELDENLLEMLPSSEQSRGGAGFDDIARQLVNGRAELLDPTSLNTLLTWRENLLFAVPDRANARLSTQIDYALTERLRGTPLDALVLEAGLDYRVGRLGGRLSGGQRQLVTLGRVLISSAQYIFLDEPTSAFDPQLKNDVIAALKRQSARRSIVVITHDMELARACDRVLFIKEGSLVGQDSWDTLAAYNDVFRSWHAAEAGAAQ